MGQANPQFLGYWISKHSDFGYLFASLLFQLVLGLFFGHVYDQRISMATGYLVATGQNPYIPQDLTGIFNNQSFTGMTSIGYPPSWPLLLGVIYRLSYAIIPNLLVYNLAIKLPIIAANIALAYLVRGLIKERTLNEVISRRAWIFLLFNPYLLYFTAAWGQFDSLVALFTLLSLVLLDKDQNVASAILLALSLSLKPISIPVVLVVILYLGARSWFKLARYIIVFVMSTILFCVVPFMVLGWDASPVLNNWNAQFTVSGGMSFMTFYELVSNTYTLPGWWWLLGIAWVPVILFSVLLYPSKMPGFTDLLKVSLALILVFYLTRTWLSEPNISLILPMVLILTSLGELPKITLTITWLLPLVFTVFNTSPPQLLFIIQSNQMEKLLHWMDTFRTARLVMRVILVIPWLFTGWWVVTRFLRNTKSSTA